MFPLIDYGTLHLLNVPFASPLGLLLFIFLYFLINIKNNGKYLIYLKK